MTRLSTSVLASGNHTQELPVYDRSAFAGVVHLGLGAFHRAHQAVYFDRLMRQGEAGWMIRGASLRSSTAADQLMPQNSLFTLAVRDGAETTYETIGSIKDVVIATQDPRSLVTALASPEVQLVTLTVTEKGYCVDPTTGELKSNDPGIVADVEDLSRPQTAPGYIVAGLAARRAAGLGPFTVLSCDNLPENGIRTRQAVVGLAELIDPKLAQWITQNVAFPSSMVDRIVPATTDEDRDRIESVLGYRDEAAVKSEPFSQWVVEDWFCAKRPSLDNVGVTFTKAVEPWEKTKLRLLNGAHSALAYLGSLAGYEYVHTAIAAPGFINFINGLWDESSATLDTIQGFDVGDYRRDLLNRFGNSALAHRTRQIAMDGSLKLPQRLIAPIAERQKLGLSSPALTLAVAGWFRWQEGVDDAGERHDINDPIAALTAKIVDENKESPDEYVAAMLGIQSVFGEDLIKNADFVSDLKNAFLQLKEYGVEFSVKSSNLFSRVDEFRHTAKLQP